MYKFEKRKIITIQSSPINAFFKKKEKKKKEIQISIGK